MPRQIATKPIILKKGDRTTISVFIINIAIPIIRLPADMITVAASSAFILLFLQIGYLIDIKIKTTMNISTIIATAMPAFPAEPSRFP
jgi:hypothetical protein